MLISTWQDLSSRSESCENLEQPENRLAKVTKWLLGFFYAADFEQSRRLSFDKRVD